MIRRTILVFGMTWALKAQIPDFTPPTPLMDALMHDNTSGVRNSLLNGADPNGKGFLGFPPVFFAVMHSNLEVLRAMVAKGADVKARDASGSTALMWAAYNDRVDTAMVEELLKLGVDVNASNQAGETALTWALRRGETPVAAVLRNHGAMDNIAIKTAAQKAISLLQKSGVQFTKVSGCVSCHHQFLPQMAIAVARTRGIEIDEHVEKEQLLGTIAVFRPIREEVLKKKDRVPDPPTSLGYALLGLAAEKYPADETTAAMASLVAQWQSGDGGFYGLPVRPPLEGSNVTGTALGVRAVQLYGKISDEKIASTREWLRSVRVVTSEDRAMRLLGLKWTGASKADLNAAACDVIAQQRSDGGWAQLDTLETDAYATGQALTALAESGEMSVSDPVYRRGISYLLRTQIGDGSWLVRTRSFAVQPLKDSGFPHGRDQWISAAGTSWAAMALSLALPKEQ